MLEPPALQWLCCSWAGRKPPGSGPNQAPYLLRADYQRGRVAGASLSAMDNRQRIANLDLQMRQQGVPG